MGATRKQMRVKNIEEPPICGRTEIDGVRVSFGQAEFSNRHLRMLHGGLMVEELATENMVQSSRMTEAFLVKEGAFCIAILALEGEPCGMNGSTTLSFACLSSASVRNETQAELTADPILDELADLYGACPLPTLADFSGAIYPPPNGETNNPFFMACFEFPTYDQTKP